MLKKNYPIDGGYKATKDKVLAVLRQDGYEIGEDLEDRLDHFFACIEKRPDQRRIDELRAWFEEKKRECGMEVEVVKIKDIDRWGVDPETGFIAHESGEFFKVIGIHVTNSDLREQAEWCQPIIYQEEMGILGIICKNIGGVRHYLLQAKAEPGNVGKVHISPTLQATISNLRRAHGGKKPLYAEHFETPRPGTVIYATYQTEDGGRLHLKTYLNMIVEAGEKEFTEIPDNFRWFTMWEIKQLLKYENTVNLHIRSIISPL
jgi:oxidase EvaA